MLRTTVSPFGARGVFRVPPATRSAIQPRRVPTNTPFRSFTQRTNRPTTSPNFSTKFTFSSSPIASRTIIQRLQALRFFSRSRARLNGKPTSPNPTPNINSPGVEAEAQTLAGRLRKLSREYGWAAVGVYFTLSALDFPFCYLFVKSVGTDKIGHYEEVVVGAVKSIIPDSVKQSWHEWRSSMKKAEHNIMGADKVEEGVEMAGWGVEEAQENHKRDASLATQLALAYAIHKSFIIIRVPITAAITPKIVKTLRGWGWEIGKRTTKEAKAIRRATLPKAK